MEAALGSGRSSRSGDCKYSCVNVRDSIYPTNRTESWKHMWTDAIRKLAKKIAKDVKTEADLGDFSKLLKKIVVITSTIFRTFFSGSLRRSIAQ